LTQAKKWRVLIVDDEEGIREHLAEAFTGAGFAVTTAGDDSVDFNLRYHS